MADAAVEFLLENLKQLLLYHAKLLSGAQEQIEKLDNHLRRFKSFLRDSTKKRRKDERLRDLVREIRDVVYEAEDVIDAFVTQAADSRSRNYFSRAFHSPKKLLNIAKQVEAVSRKITDLYGDGSWIDFATLDLKDQGQEEAEAPAVRQDNVVGFEDEAERIIGYLKEELETNQLDVVSIIGMPGLGKTTLTGKIFRDPDIQYEFPTRIWVYVSQEFTRKAIFLSILKEFTTIDDKYHNSDQDLANLVSGYLEKGKILIVMDDVWTPEDWNKLKIAFPLGNKHCKVVITSRQEEVARHANRSRLPHKLRFLTSDESWLLLQWEVFGKPECPPDLEGLGRVISGQCDGLPLAIVVIGGILAKAFSPSDEMNAMRNAWRKVSERVSTYLNSDPERRMEKIISLSYDKLPYHLRACFLYLGLFPEDFEIPVWKLVRMWIAEGFIQKKSSDISLEETAESYLEELIKRNLVGIGQMRPDGRVKTCRIHDMLRDFCKTEAGNERENFLQEIKNSTDGGFEPPISSELKYRRLCIHSNVPNFFASRPFGPRIRSFACFSKEKINLPSENTSAIPAAFKLVRVLDVEPITFSKIPTDLYNLVHLRYIALSFSLGVLPPAFCKLFNVQTLIVDTTSRTLEIKADISKMTQLRHLKTNAASTLVKPKPDKNSKEGEKLQTLGMISPQSCTDEVLDKARNLKRLGVRGQLGLLLDGKTGSFDSLGKLDHLGKLKLVNDPFPLSASEGKLRSLPPPYKFPPKLRILTLSDTYLEWNQMAVLGLLENLEVLKLKERAFVGRYWESADGGFRHLEVLHIGRTDLTSWSASHHHFPRLLRLQLENCENLQDIPIGLADIPSFQLLDLHRTQLAAASARRIEARKNEQKDPNTTKLNGFKLSVFPSDR